MTLKIDKGGRLVLPKPVRARLGLRAGTDLEMQETPEGIVLRPVLKWPSLLRAGRFLVHTGRPLRDFSVLRAIPEDRDGRMRKLSGL